MKKSQGMNALLIELVIVLFFFILSFTVLAQVYAYTYRTESTAALQNEALFEARNLSARMRAEGQPERFLQQEASEKTENGYLFPYDGYTLRVTCQPEQKEFGIYYHIHIDAVSGKDTLWTPEGQPVSLSASVYVPEVDRHE